MLPVTIWYKHDRKLRFLKQTQQKQMPDKHGRAYQYIIYIYTYIYSCIYSRAIALATPYPAIGVVYFLTKILATRSVAWSK
jgi:hypothetical protein